MKPSSWYASTLVVAFFYLYVLAIQYVRAESEPVSSKITFEDESNPSSLYNQDSRPVDKSTTSDAGPSLYSSENMRSIGVGVGSSLDVSPSLYPNSGNGDSTDTHREVGIGSDNLAVTSFNSYPSESSSSYLPDNAGSLRAVGVGNAAVDRAVGNSYRPGYSYDPSYNGHNQFYTSASDAVPVATDLHQQDSSYTLDLKYHNYEKLTKFLRTTSSKFPNLTALYSIGKSVQGKSSSLSI